MSDHAKFVALAQRLIAKHGRALNIQFLSGIAADPAKPWKGAGTPTVANSHPVIGVFVPISSAEELGIGVMGDELLKKTSQLLLVAGDNNDYAAADLVEDSGVGYRITFCEKLTPGDTTILYYFGVSR